MGLMKQLIGSARFGREVRPAGDATTLSSAGFAGAILGGGIGRGA